MSKSLVIVESPAKAKTLGKYLGKDFRIEATKGHIRDLPEKRFGVDLKNRFRPEYQILAGREKVVAHLKKAAENVDVIYLASDPDREGEAIAWHVSELLGMQDKCYRATFNEVTQRAVRQAVENPGRLNQNLVDAQQARRILDRLVGYKISPLLGRQFRWGLSAGRVQSVAVRLVVEREREIRAFVPDEYWNIEAAARAANPPPFVLKFASINGEKVEVKTADQAHAIVEAVRDRPFEVVNIDKREVRRKPAAPFITSTLQQEASRKLRMTTTKTMSVAQRLYEGVEMGAEGAVGLITYMRTDSVHLSRDAVEAARDFIRQAFGPKFIPPTPPNYKSGKAAQEAHEAVRPTDLAWTPERAAPFLAKDELALYQLIWNRFIASQMAPAVLEQTRVDASPDQGRHVFAATGQVVRFQGFLALYEEGRDDEDDEDDEKKTKKKKKAEDEVRLPRVEVGESLTIDAVTPSQHFTKPPPRFNEATLVRELERLGIGRPSTYAAIVSTIQQKKYVEKDKGRFLPTETGELVTDVLVKSFPDIMNANFTARMESELDDVEQGKLEWTQVLDEFYEKFKVHLDEAVAHMRSIKQEAQPTDIPCYLCGKTMNLRTGPYGKFLACSGYPECKATQNAEIDPDGTIRPVPKARLAEEIPCDQCGRPMALKNGRRGPFLACTGYPECKNTCDAVVGEADSDGTIRPIVSKARLAEEIPCGQCGRPMALKNGRRGPFLACTGYPECKSTCDAIVGDDGLYRPASAQAASPGESTAASSETRGPSSPKKTGSGAAPTDYKCEECGAPMVARHGRFGPFLSCSAYPKCKAIKKITKDMSVALPPKPKPVETDVKCEACGRPMVMRSSKRGSFLGCSGFPKCRTIQQLPEHMKSKAGDDKGGS